MACNLYKIPQAATPATLTYTDCDGINQTVSVPGGTDYYFCSTNLISVPTETEDLGECKCQCFFVYSTGTLPDINVYYVDCDGNLATLNNLTAGMRFCGLKFLNANDSSGAIIGTDGSQCILGEGYNCQDFDPTCYTISNGEGNPVRIYYIDSTGQPQVINDNGPIDFCATYVLTTSYDEYGNLTPGVPEGTVTANGVCVFSSLSGDYECLGPVDCNCYYGYVQTEGTTVDHVTCNDEIITSTLSIGFNKLCSKYIIKTTPTTTFYNSGVGCVDGACQNYCCQCYTVSNLTGALYTLTYLNCDLQLATIDLTKVGQPGSVVQICALNVPLDGENITIELNGSCYNGQCVAEMSLESQLLYGIKTTLGPCPDICCGKNKAYGGSNGLKITDIKTGLIL